MPKVYSTSLWGSRTPDGTTRTTLFGTKTRVRGPSASQLGTQRVCSIAMRATTWRTQRRRLRTCKLVGSRDWKKA
ncbi:hypothetical protein CaCOL14_000371 [Colletotrichum acutatum]